MRPLTAKSNPAPPKGVFGPDGPNPPFGDQRGVQVDCRQVLALALDENTAVKDAVHETWGAGFPGKVCESRARCPNGYGPARVTLDLRDGGLSL